MKLQKKVRDLTEENQTLVEQYCDKYADVDDEYLAVIQNYEKIVVDYDQQIVKLCVDHDLKMKMNLARHAVDIKNMEKHHHEQI